MLSAQIDDICNYFDTLDRLLVLVLVQYYIKAAENNCDFT